MLAAARSDSWATALRALRARQWWHFALLPAAPTGLGIGAIAIGIVLAALALAYAYGLNALSDRATDLDADKNPLSAARVCPPQLPALLALLGGAALTLAAIAAPSVLVAVATSLAASTMYSVGPRLKSLPLTGTLLNAVIFTPLFWCAPGAAASGAPRLLLVVFVTLLLQNQLLHERADAEEDARAGAWTSGRALGAAGTHAVVVALALAGMEIARGVGAATAAWSAAAVLALVTVGALVGAGGAAARRERHRRFALAGGALLFLVTR